jgi:transposase
MNHPLPPQTEMAAWVGLDWADQQHVVSLQAADSPRIESQLLRQKPEALQEWINSLRERFSGRPVAVALEQSRGPLLYALMSTDFLILYPINPKTLAKYRESLYPSGAKDDPRDADLLRELIQRFASRFRAWKPEDPATRQLQLLVQHRRKLCHEKTRLTNQLTIYLKSYFPQALEWVGELDSYQACDFLQRWPTLSALQKATPGRIRKFYRLHHCHSTSLIDSRLAQIRQARPLTEDPAVVEAFSLMVKSRVGPLRPLLESLAELDRRLQKLFDQHPDHDIFASFPAAGPVLGPRLLSALGSDRTRFTQASELQNFSGVAPVTKQSGRTRIVSMRWACPRFLRQTFVEYAAASCGKSEWARTFYALKAQQRMKHHAILRELAFKWIRIILRCWQNRTPYVEAQYLAQLQKRKFQGRGAVLRMTG